MIRIRFLLVLELVVGFMTTQRSRYHHPSIGIPVQDPNTALRSTSGGGTFYNDFEDFEDDDDDAYDEIDDEAVANFRNSLDNMFGVGNDDDSGATPTKATPNKPPATSDTEGMETVDDFIKRATGAASVAEQTDWAQEAKDVKGGVVLLANPAKFCNDFGSSNEGPSVQLLNKFGLTLPPPVDLGPDRRADLLPVLFLLDHNALRGSQALLLNRRTGYLLGDLEQQQQQQQQDDDSNQEEPKPPRLGAFMIQPLWFGGTSAGDQEQAGGLDMLHQCPWVPGAKELTADGLYWGGDPADAQDAMKTATDRTYTGFDFKFFVQSTRWLPLQLEKEIKDGTWFKASVSKEVLFKPRDRLGTRRAKPLWTEIMELMGGEYGDVVQSFYASGQEQQ